MPDPPTPDEAIRILEAGRGRTEEQLGRLSRADLLRHGLGGGEWSPKDLIGHLTSWEEHALDALAAWERGERAPIDDLWRTLSTARLNAQNVDRKSSWSLPRIRRESERVHAELLEAIRSTTDARWASPATPRGRRPLGLRLGSILGGPAGPFRHDEAHHPTLRSFVEASESR